MEHQTETNTSENLKLYDEILAIKKLRENQENDLNHFDVSLPSLPVDTIMLLNEFSNSIFEIGLQDVDQFNLQILLYEAILERIEYVKIIKELQLESRKWEEYVNQELRDIKTIEEGKADLLTSIVPLPKLEEEISFLEKQIETMRKKEAHFSPTSLKCMDQLLVKLHQIEIKKNNLNK